MLAVSGGQVPLIIDTDASFDVDDVVAICMAHALMDAGEVEIKVMRIDLLTLRVPPGRHLISIISYAKKDQYV